MAGTISTKDQIRIMKIINQGYITKPTEWQAVLNLARISNFMPADEEFIEVVFDELFEYYPRKFHEMMDTYSDTVPYIHTRKQSESH